MAVFPERNSRTEREVRAVDEEKDKKGEQFAEDDDVEIDGMVRMLSQRLGSVQADDDGTGNRRGGV